MLLKNRVISIDDTKKLESLRPSLPMTYNTLLTTITQAFGDPSIKELGTIISESKEQLENCRTYINLLNIKQLTGNELF